MKKNGFKVFFAVLTLCVCMMIPSYVSAGELPESDVSLTLTDLEANVDSIQNVLERFDSWYPDRPVNNKEGGTFGEPTGIVPQASKARVISSDYLFASVDIYGQGFIPGTTMDIDLILESSGSGSEYYLCILDPYDEVCADYSDYFSSSAGITYETVSWDIPWGILEGEYTLACFLGEELIQIVPFYITYSEIPATEIVVESSEIVLQVGDSEIVSALLSPLGATTPRNLVWTSSNESVAVVEDTGLDVTVAKEIQAVGRGTCTITITQGNLTTSITVHVSEMPFKDVLPNKWYYNACKWAYTNGLLKGTSDTTLSPEDPMTRGMLVTVLYRMEGRPGVSGNVEFPDVISGKYYEKPIIWAAEQNIVSGYTNGNFGPEDSITREQIAKILYRYAEYKGFDVSASSSLDGFEDASQVSPYAVRYMKWAVAEDLIQGSNGKLNPKDDATRAQIAAIFKRFVEKYE